MIWVLPALGAAFFMAAADGLTKRYFSDLPLAQAVLVRLSGLAVSGLVILSIVPWPELDSWFYWGVAAALPAEVAAVFLYIRALQISPLSLTVPFTAFTPAFSMIPGMLILGEAPSWQGFMGLGLLVAGIYGLNLHRFKQGWLAPFKAVTTEKGSWMMLLVSLLYAYTAVMGRGIVLHSSPWFVAGIYPVILFTCVSIGLAAKGKLDFSWKKRPLPVLALALCMAAMAVCHFQAVALVQTAYMVAVKRLSIVFAMAYGALVFKEAKPFQHLAAGVVVVLGGVIIVVWG
jgi:drug/metabolite transporter (DMT)-like permease